MDRHPPKRGSNNRGGGGGSNLSGRGGGGGGSAKNSKRNNKKQQAPTPTAPIAQPEKLKHGTGTIVAIDTSSRVGEIAFEGDHADTAATFDLDHQMDLIIPKVGLHVSFDWWESDDDVITACALRLQTSSLKNAVYFNGGLHPVPEDDDSILAPLPLPPEQLCSTTPNGCLCHVSLPETGDEVNFITPRWCVAMVVIDKTSTTTASPPPKHRSCCGRVMAPGVAGDLPLSATAPTFAVKEMFKCVVIFDNGSNGLHPVSLAQERRAVLKSAFMSEVELRNTLCAPRSISFEIGNWERLCKAPLWKDPAKCHTFFEPLTAHACNHFMFLESISSEQMKLDECHRFCYLLLDFHVFTTEATLPNFESGGEDGLRSLAQLVRYFIRYYQHDVKKLKPIFDKYDFHAVYNFEEMVGTESRNLYQKLKRPEQPISRRVLPPPQKLHKTDVQDHQPAAIRIFDMPHFEELLTLSSETTPKLRLVDNRGLSIPEYVAEQAETYRASCFLQGEGDAKSCVDYLKLLKHTHGDGSSGTAAIGTTASSNGLYPRPEYVDSAPYLDWNPLHCSRAPFCHNIRFAPSSSSLIQKINWKTTERLRDQSVVAVVALEEKRQQLLWGVVVNDDARPKGIVGLQFSDIHDAYFSDLVRNHQPFVLLETHCMLFQSEPILRSLAQVCNYTDDDPASTLLAAIASSAPNLVVGPPKYAQPHDYNSFLPPSVKLDPEQEQSIKGAFENQIFCIQGPPGTGKSFTGTQIVCCAAQMMQRTANKGPILIITFKNHSLEEILKDVAKANSRMDIVRIGGKFTDDPVLKKMRLNGRVARRDRGTTDVDIALEELLKAKKNLNDVTNHMAMQWAPAAQRIAILHTTKHEDAESMVEQWLSGASSAAEATALKVKATQCADSDDSDDDLNAILDDLRGDEDDPDEEIDPDEADIGVSQMKEVSRAFGAHQPSLHLDTAPSYADHNAAPDDQSRDWLFSLIEKKPNPWTWSKKDRKRAMQFWHRNAIDALLEEVDELQNDYEVKKSERLSADLKSRVNVLRRANVVGVTATSCTINLDLVKAVQPRVLIVEEAAEILEVNTIACIANNTEHVVLVGDHQQLRPNVDCYDVQEHCKLRYSLFERLVVNGFPHSVLQTQRRMHPDICNVVEQFYAKGISNHDAVLVTRKNPFEEQLKQLLNERTLFWSHKTSESRADVGQSLINKTEAKMINTFINLITHYGVPPTSITVLSYYLGQVRYLRKLLSGREGVDVRTVDSFQGDENDIVVVSLVRRDKPTGHMKMENRMIVALSRARLFSMVVGNQELLLQFPHWKKALGRQVVMPKLKVSCPHHPTKVAELTPESKHQFCKERCRYHFPDCNHQCTETCHSTPHTVCTTQVEVFPLNCANGAHKVLIACHDRDTRPLCEERVDFARECGCIENIKCHVRAQIEADRQREEELLGRCTTQKTTGHPKCGHTTAVACADLEEPYLSNAAPPCKEKIQKRCNQVDCKKFTNILCCDRDKRFVCEQPYLKTLPCSHTKLTRCCNRDDTVKCEELTVFKCPQCSVARTLKCHETTVPPPCTNLVASQSCPENPRHECPCSDQKLPCKATIERILDCGHKGTVVCGSNVKLRRCNETVTLKQPKCSHTYTVKCPLSKNPPPVCRKECSRLLPCGKHKCSRPCTKSCEVVCTTCEKEEAKRQNDELHDVLEQFRNSTIAEIPASKVIGELNVTDISQSVARIFGERWDVGCRTKLLSPASVELLRFGEWKNRSFAKGRAPSFRFLATHASQEPPQHQTKGEFYFRSRIEAKQGEHYTIYVCDLADVLTRDDPRSLTDGQRQKLLSNQKVSVHDPTNHTYTFVDRDFREAAPFIKVCDVTVVATPCSHQFFYREGKSCFNCCINAIDPQTRQSAPQPVFDSSPKLSFVEALRALLLHTKCPPSRPDLTVADEDDVDLFIKKVGQMLPKVKSSSSQLVDDCHLTDDDIQALISYKMEHPYPMYKWLNAQLLSGDRSCKTSVEAVGPFFTLLLRAQEKLPLQRCKAARSVRVNNPILELQFKEYEATFAGGQLYTMWNVSSFSTSDEVINQFLGNTTAEGIVFTCPELAGVDMEPFKPDDLPPEAEILPFAPAIFKVQCSTKIGKVVSVAIVQVPNADIAYLSPTP